MKIVIVTPAPPGSRKGNRITAARWRRLLEDLGHRVALKTEYRGEACDVLFALHALKSFPAVERWRRTRPEIPCVLALTGTDLYDKIHTETEAQQALEWATRLIVLQPLGIRELPKHLRPKARVVYQSIELPAGVAPGPRRRRSADSPFTVCVVGHLRPVKDPFRTAQAARLLPASSRIEVRQLGGALSQDMAELARAEEKENPRYRWLGEMPRAQALRFMARSQLLALTSLLEGGANVISEASAVGLPVLSSRISGSIGLLGPDYPGYFRVGDSQALAKLLQRAENDRDFYRTLQRGCRRLRPLIRPARERATLRQLLREVT